MNVTSRGNQGQRPPWRALSLLPAIVWAGVIFYFSSIPGRDMPSLFPHADMVFHFFEYFIFCGLIYFGLKNYRETEFRLPVKKLLTLALAIACLYAISDEFHQLFVPGRYGDVFDFLIDALGAASFSMLNLFIFN